MNIFNGLSLLGGLALFLYGMNVMGDGLAKTAGSKLEQILEKLTSTPIRGVVLGAAVTAVIQSSSATTVMVVGFVNSGIMKLRQAVGIIMGANIGTTITSWILSLSGIESDNIWIKMLKPSSFSPILAVIGIIFLMFCKSSKKKDIGGILLGFAVLMFGMETMSDAVAPLADVPEFTNILTMFENPFMGMLAGALLTAIIQSSSASVGILQALCATGSVTFSAAIPIIMGQNIGTCVTALLSSIGAKKNARRAAVVHLYFNIIGTVLFMTAFYGINAVIGFSFLGNATRAADIAIVHTLFNVLATSVLLPFNKLLEKLAILTVRDKMPEDNASDELGMLTRLDARFLEKPGFAVAQCADAIHNMAKLSRKALLLSLEMLEEYTPEKKEEVEHLENVIDSYEDELGTYMVKLSNKELSLLDSQTVAMGLHSIGDWERISDHAINIAEIFDKMHTGKMRFSDKAMTELRVYTNALTDIITITTEAFFENDLNKAFRVEPLEEVIDYLNAVIKKHHIKRLQKGKCTIEMGIALENLINNYERVADHCSNVAAVLLQLPYDTFDTHEYLGQIKEENNIEFQAMYQMYKGKYSL